MYPNCQIALQRQAEIRAAAAHHRMVREARSGSRPSQARTLRAWTRRFRLIAAHSRPAQA